MINIDNRSYAAYQRAVVWALGRRCCGQAGSAGQADGGRDKPVLMDKLADVETAVDDVGTDRADV